MTGRPPAGFEARVVHSRSDDFAEFGDVTDRPAPCIMAYDRRSRELHVVLEPVRAP